MLACNCVHPVAFFQKCFCILITNGLLLVVVFGGIPVLICSFSAHLMCLKDKTKKTTTTGPLEFA